MSEEKTTPETEASVLAEPIEDLEVTEAHGDEVRGGFNPQPDPPGRQLSV